MQPTIDETHAWEWILAARNSSAQPPDYGERTVPDPRQKAPDLHLRADGSWHLAVESTPAAGLLFRTCLPLCAPGTERLVIGQTGQTLDGRIATGSGTRQVINGPEGLTHLHRLRALVDVVLVGTGTARADDPQLTVRAVSGPNPVRAVIDRQARLPQSLRVFTDGQARTLRLIGPDCRVPDPGNDQVTLLRLPSSGVSPCAPGEILDRLAAVGLHRVLVEGGSETLSGFLQAGCLTHLHVLVAPIILGSGVPSVSLPVVDDVRDGLQPACEVTPLGRDTLFAFSFPPPAPAGPEAADRADC